MLDQPPPSRCSTSYLAPGRIIWGILGSSCVDAGLHSELWRSCVIAPLRQSRTENKKCIQTSVVLYETSYSDNMETHGCVRKMGVSVQICKETTRKVSVCVVHPTPECAQTQQISIRPVLGCRLQGHVGSLYLSFICLPSLQDALAPYFKAVHGLAPEYATEQFCPSQPVCSLSSSGRSLLRVPSPRVKTKGG